ncbi:MAG: hypothetical protein IPI73_23685 [Betaproteobacteria bacterium]|nr:hypothetical protein [Betaproteobacteria bacterium]
MRETPATFTRSARPAGQFEGDSAILDPPRARELPAAQEVAQEERLSHWLWILPLVLVIAVVYWGVSRAVEESRVDTYVQLLRDQPGVVVTGSERRDGLWHVSGLRDPLATDPPTCWPRRTLAPIASPATGSPIRR